MQFVVGIKVVGFLSFLLGCLLLGICGWTMHEFIKGEIGRNSTVQDGSKKGVSSSYQENESPERLIDTLDEARNTLKDLKDQWKEFKPFLLGSGGLALGAGVLQVITSLIILCVGPKGSRDRSGCFKCTHFVILILLIAALVVPAVFDLSHESWSHRLKEIYIKIQHEIKNIKFDESFSPNVIVAYYGVITVDICGMIFLIVSTCCLMRNAEYDYRAY